MFILRGVGDLSKICSVNDCQRVVFDKSTECVLHCKKNDYSEDYHNNGILNKFYDALVEYVVKSAFEWSQHQRTSVINEKSLRDYVINERSDSEVVSFLMSKTIVFNHIFFPCNDGRDSFDYIKILRKIGGAHFNYCSFTAHSVDVSELNMFFEDCHFFQYWTITQCKLLGNFNNVLYQNCVFCEEVSSFGEPDSKGVLDLPLFNDCEFKGSIVFGNLSLKQPIFNNDIDHQVNIDELRIENCELDGKFVLNKLRARYFVVKNSEFKSKVELKEGCVNDFEINNTNFARLFDSYNTEYGGFYCFKSIFSDFVGFEKCKFSSFKSTKDLGLISTFKYVTFLSFTNFRNSVFCEGLDLQDTNLKEAPNFLNITLLSERTNRETLRIIKDSFDKIGNHIEANKFFVLEMRKYKEELEGGGVSQEKIIFWLNEKASNFGQNFILPAFWVVVFSIIYYLLVLGHESNILYKLYPPINDKIRFLSNVMNGVASNIIPFKDLLRKGMEFVSLMFYIVFASLVWLIIVAVKRHTRR